MSDILSRWDMDRNERAAKIDGLAERAKKGPPLFTESTAPEPAPQPLEDERKARRAAPLRS
jgi:hypothetical protein